jgi:two-component system, NarL family, sensor histidine kinase DevS
MSPQDPARAAGPHDAATPSAALTPLSAAGLDDLLRELLQRVGQAQTDHERLQLLLDAVVAIGADLDLDSVLRRIVEVASRLADARYVALGVLGAGPGRRLRAFVTHGLTPEQHTAIGDLPRGHGLLGLIIDRPEPLRLHDLNADPNAYGFPPGHPPMRSFLGVPVRIRDKVFGNLYLTEKLGDGDFTEQDEAIVVALAAAAGVAIENARLYEEAARRERWLAATAEITGLLLASSSRDDALRTVAERAREIARADLGCVVLRRADDELELRIVSGLAPAAVLEKPFHLDRSLAGLVISTGAALVVPDVSTDHRPAEDLVGRAGWPVLGPVIVVPLRTSGGIQGALTLAWSRAGTSHFHEVDVRLPQGFAEQAALALEVDQARVDQERLAVFEDRDRIGRDLHDLVIQRLFAIGLTLENTTRMTQRPEVAERIAGAVDDIDATIKDIRRSIFALSVADTSDDVRRTVTDLVDRAARALTFRPTVRFVGPVNAVVTSVVAQHLAAVLGEALSNVVRHAAAGSVQVVLEAGERVSLTVHDNGGGIPEGATRSGLLNMRQRAEDLGGSCTVESAPGAGTTVLWEVPAR